MCPSPFAVLYCYLRYPNTHVDHVTSVPTFAGDGCVPPTWSWCSSINLTYVYWNFYLITYIYSGHHGYSATCFHAMDYILTMVAYRLTSRASNLFGLYHYFKVVY